MGKTTRYTLDEIITDHATAALRVEFVDGDGKVISIDKYAPGAEDITTDIIGAALKRINNCVQSVKVWYDVDSSAKSVTFSRGVDSLYVVTSGYPDE